MAGESIIHFSCPNCGKTLRVMKEHVGKRSKCPQCHSELKIPDSSNEFEDTRIRFKCPQCAKSITVTAANAGKTGRCPRCKSLVKAPPVKGQPKHDIDIESTQVAPPSDTGTKVATRVKDSKDIHTTDVKSEIKGNCGVRPNPTKSILYRKIRIPKKVLVVLEVLVAVLLSYQFCESIWYKFSPWGGTPFFPELSPFGYLTNAILVVMLLGRSLDFIFNLTREKVAKFLSPLAILFKIELIFCLGLLFLIMTPIAIQSAGRWWGGEPVSFRHYFFSEKGIPTVPFYGLIAGLLGVWSNFLFLRDIKWWKKKKADETKAMLREFHERETANKDSGEITKDT